MLNVKNVVFCTAFIIIVQGRSTKNMSERRVMTGTWHPKWGTKEVVVFRLFFEAISYRGSLGRLVCASLQMWIGFDSFLDYPRGPFH